jgi:UDP-GlcNAc:undecaprenyl-phosphate GlcNAc-1-phosphate transferase
MPSLPNAVVYGGVFAVAFAATWGLTPVVGWLSRRYGMLAVPGGRRRHQGLVPRLGGLAIYGGFMVAVLLTLSYHDAPADRYRLCGLLLGATVIAIGGLLDDRLQFSALPQMGVALVAALIATRYWVFLERVGNPFSSAPGAEIVFPLPLTVALTLLWYAGMTTTLNWLDGLDGLATGVSAIAALVFSVHMMKTQQYSVALLALALLGATLGFLPSNWHPARIFLGSTGAYFLGFTVGALGLIGGARAATSLLVLAIPILDVAWLIFHRLRRRRSPVHGDRWHLHFRLLDLGLPHQRIVLGYYALSGAFGLLALLLPSRLYKLLAMVALAVVAVGFLAIVSRLGEEKEQADAHGQ